MLPAADRPASDREVVPSAKELLRLGGIDAEAWARFQDGHPWSEPEQETLQKIMLRLAQLPIDDVERLASTTVDWERLTSDPSAYRGDIVRLRGRVRALTVRRLPEPMARRFELNAYYRVEMELDETGQPVVVFARTVPRAWRAGGSIDAPGGAWAMFVKLGADDGSDQTPVFTASRVASYSEDQLLGRLGMDVGLMDDLADRRPIRGEERECFYQALAAVGRAREGELRKAAAARLARQGADRDSVAPLFNDPADQRGKLVMLSGTARRVLKIRVDDPDVRRRFGIDHYYEIYLYTDDSQGNPVVFCTRHLPKDMPTGEGPNYGEAASVAGFFLKSWAYPSGQTYQPDEDGRPGAFQLAPLLVGRDVAWRPTNPPNRSPFWGAAIGIAFVLVLFAIWFWLLRAGRASRTGPRRAPGLSEIPNDAADSNDSAGRAGVFLDFPRSKKNNSSGS